MADLPEAGHQIGASLRALFAAAAALLAESHLLRKLRAGGGVIGRDHRIIRRQAPLLPVLLGSHVVLRPQMPLEGLELLAILETDDVVWRDRFLQRHGGLERLGSKVSLTARNTGECRVNLVDQSRQVLRLYGIIAHIGRYDFRRQLDERSRRIVAHWRLTFWRLTF